MQNIQLKEEIEQMLTSGELLNQMVGYAYKHCFSREEAEELCQEIIIQILEGISKGGKIQNLEGYIWRIAYNTYADHVARRKKYSLRYQSIEVISESHDEGFEGQYIHQVMKEHNFKIIRKRIAFLIKIYRDVMVMFYLEEMSIKEIASILEIPENRVKQRLFSAKKQIREEVSTMENNYQDNLLKPIKMHLVGTGKVTNSGVDKLERLLAQNIIDACYKKAKTIKELAEELNIPTIFMENEVGYLSTKPNFLRCVDQQKYSTDMIIIDEEIQDQVNKQIEKIVDEFSKEITQYLREKEEKIMSLEYLGGKKKFSFILWSIIMRFSDQLNEKVQEKVKVSLKELGIEIDTRDFYLMGIIEGKRKAEGPKPNFYGSNGSYAEGILGYQSVFMQNYYGYRLPWESGRFDAGENIGANSELMMILRTIGGLEIEGLSEKEQEVVAKAIQKGYVRKENKRIVPNVIVIESSTKHQLDQYIQEASTITQKYVDVFGKSYEQLTKKYMPKHLLGQAHIFTQLTLTTMRSYLVEACIQNRLLHIPDTNQCGEGIIITIEK